MRDLDLYLISRNSCFNKCDGRTRPIQEDDSLLIPKTGIHTIENTGKSRLYILTIMMPNEDFFEMIRSGTPTELDEEDLAVLQRKASPVLSY